MSAFVSPVAALDAAFARYQRASGAFIGAVSGGSEDAGAAVAEMIEAKVQAKAVVSTVRFSDEMFKALIEIVR